MTSHITYEQAEQILAGQVHPRITEDFIKSQISNVDYLNHKELTICIITLANGFMVNGQSASADPRNSVQELGNKYAYEDAFEKLWSLFAFRLCDARTGGVESLDPGHLPHNSYDQKALRSAVNTPRSRKG
jgi:Phage protein (N4 Gp49/phage Sf6 gene 66) family